MKFYETLQMVFELQTILTSNFNFGGRFGTTLGQIGDVNRDAHNDIAISAPYEGQGVVYIFLGGPRGLSTKVSQKIFAPEAPKIPYTDYEDQNAMFGFGISRGADIDENLYYDIAISSPNAETIYIYKSHPVVRVNTKISPLKQKLSETDTDLDLEVCMKFTGVSKLRTISKFCEKLKIFYILSIFTALFLSFQMDSRCTFKNVAEVDKIITLRKSESCRNYSLTITHTQVDLSKPLKFHMDFDSAQKIPENSKNFCDTCFMLDHRYPKSFFQKFAFKSGCAQMKCLSDLVLERKLNFSEPFVMGSAKSVVIVYEISNYGEPAYLPKLKLTINLNVTQFSKVNSECTLEPNNEEMTCDINNGKPLKTNDKKSFEITLETSRLTGSSFGISAEIYSSSDEKNSTDNKNDEQISVIEVSELELEG